jgi:hypothetical protein
MAADRLLDLSAPHGLSRWLVALQRAALLLGLVSAAVLLGRTFNHPVPARVAVLLLVGLDLALPNERINPVAPVSLYRFQPPALAYVPASHQERVYVYDYDHGFARSPSLLRRPDPYRMTLPDSDALRWVEAVGMRSYLAPPTAAAWGRFNSFDADALGIQPRPLRELNELFGRLEDGDPMRVRLLQMGAVSRVVALHAVAGLETLAALRSYFPDPVRVLRVPDPLPRAYYVSRAVQADGAEAAAWLVSTAFDPRREVILAESTATATDTLECSGAVTIERLTTDSVRIAAETACPGYVVLSDAYDPGWSARVDGRWAPLLRANLAFRAVPVEAGRHAIEMRYRPRLLGPGLTLSAATLLGLVWFRLRPARRRPSSAAGIRSPAR